MLDDSPEEGQPPESSPRRRLPADVTGVLNGFAERSRSRYVAMARRRLRRLMDDASVLSPEGAVHEAWIRLIQRLHEGPVPPAITDEILDGLFRSLLEQAIVDAWRRQHARKRTAPGTNRRDLDSLDLVDPESRHPEEQVVADDRLRRWLTLLRQVRGGATLQRILLLKLEGRTHREIATMLRLKSSKDLERRVRRIRSTLRPDLDEAG